MNSTTAVDRSADPRPAAPPDARPRVPLSALRLPGGRSLRWHRRATLVGLLLVAALLAVVVWSLTAGDYPLPAADVLDVLTGGGARADRYIVLEVRLPRLLTALLVGASLGLAGALFQTLARNPLGSPDVIGFTVGSATGALAVILVIGGSAATVAGGAVAGGLATSVLVYLLARTGGTQGYRLVLVGIGVSSLLSSLNAYLIARASFSDAQSAAVWLTGSLNARGWEHCGPMAVALLLLLPAAVLLGRPLRMLEMGDDAAASLGVRTEGVRIRLVLIGVGLTAAATAAAGPVPFVALIAPQAVRRLTRATGPNLLGSALLGAVLLALSDLAAQRLLAPTQLPVGVLTGVVGGCYLVWLIARQWRSGHN
ncbi:iron chelate uptake ABC transporter family permease subunit [Kitasatospora sp. NPDC049258]|uniref:FecCD family ABC transporter permease n=1 Tax=Kitasatospora sp. NPDC049258 TaxID=3155394 RepID=UPI00342DBC1E